MNYKNISKHYLLAVVLLAPITLLGQKQVKKTFSGIKKIDVTTASGSIIFQKSENASVTLDLNYTYKDDEYTPVITQEGDRLVVKEKFHKNTSSGDSDWKLWVPDNIKIEFQTGSGNIEASGLVMDLEATTGSGELVFKNISGEVQSTTGSGDVELENVNGNIKATAGSGHFRVTKSKGELTLTSGSGNLKLSESTARFKVTTGSGNIDGNSILLDGSSSFTTGSGDAEVALGASPKHNLSITSGSGDAILAFNGNQIQGEIVMQASKRHGDIEAPFAFDKTEEIDRSGDDDVTIKKTVVKGSATPHISISTGSGEAVLKN